MMQVSIVASLGGKILGSYTANTFPLLINRIAQSTTDGGKFPISRAFSATDDFQQQYFENENVEYVCCRRGEIGGSGRWWTGIRSLYRKMKTKLE